MPFCIRRSRNTVMIMFSVQILQKFVSNDLIITRTTRVAIYDRIQNEKKYVTEIIRSRNALI